MSLCGLLSVAGCSEVHSSADASTVDASDAETGDALELDAADDVTDAIDDATGGDTGRTAIDMSFLLRPSRGMTFGAESDGGHGMVLPRSTFDEIRLSGGPLVSDETDDAIYGALKVVGVRLDPCFVEGPVADQPCAAQVRVVFQPVMPMEDDPATVTARDAAIHAFYSVPLSELRELSNDLAAARTERDGETDVGVVASAERASALVLPRIGEDRLSRIAFMTGIGEFAWTFAQFDVAPGTTVLRGQQSIRATDEEELYMSIHPVPEVEADVAPYLDTRMRDMMTDEEVAAALAAFERLLDPEVHNPGTADCASCHVSTVALRYASRDDARPRSAYDDTRNLRMFGWFGTEPCISPRVITETDIALRYLER